jgi:hypothetical protein
MADSDLSEAQIRCLLRERAEEVGSARKLAQEIAIAHSYCCRILRGDSPVPDYAARMVGYRRVVVWRPVDSPSDDFSGNTD